MADHPPGRLDIPPHDPIDSQYHSLLDIAGLERWLNPARGA